MPLPLGGGKSCQIEMRMKEIAMTWPMAGEPRTERRACARELMDPEESRPMVEKRKPRD